MYKNHYYWMDYCRISAIFGVIIIHASAYYLQPYPSLDLWTRWNLNIFDSMARCSVPLFVMISGALLLNKESRIINLRQILFRIQRLLLPLIIWSVFYLSWSAYNSRSIGSWFSIFSQPASYHLWFVYMLMGLYLLLPFFQILFQATLTRPNLKYYLLFLWLAISSISIYFHLPPLPWFAYMLIGLCLLLPFFQILFQATLRRSDLKYYLLFLWLVIFSFPIYFHLPSLKMLFVSFPNAGGFFMLGAILLHSEKCNIPNWILISLYILTIAFTAIATNYLSLKHDKLYELVYNYTSLNVILASVAAFLLFSKISLPENINRITHTISDKTFIIYFVHAFILEQLVEFFENSLVKVYLSTTILVIILSILTFIISLSIAYLLRKIYLSKTLFG